MINLPLMMTHNVVPHMQMSESQLAFHSQLTMLKWRSPLFQVFLKFRWGWLLLTEVSGWLSAEIWKQFRYAGDFMFRLEGCGLQHLSLAYVGQSSSKSKLFSCLDGIFVAAMYEKPKVFKCLNNQRTTSPLKIGLNVIQSHPLRMCQLDNQPRYCTISKLSLTTPNFSILCAWVVK